MTAQALRVCQDAEKLAPSERIQIIEHLFVSLDAVSAGENMDKLWAQESEERISAYEQGKMKAMQVAEVFEKLESGRE